MTNESIETPDTEQSELEELVLKECLVSATGIRADNLQVGIKGDPSLRETIFQRPKYESPVDQVFDRLEPMLEELMLRRSTSRLYIGCNSGDIRTTSVFDPLREEIHSAEKLCDMAYIDRHFPKIGYAEKVQGIRDIYRNLRESDLFSYVPDYWQKIMVKRAKTWQPMTEEEIVTVLRSLKRLRGIEQFYLRNVTLCIVQSVVMMQFNCDGTQLVDAENYRKFLEDNLGCS